MSKFSLIKGAATAATLALLAAASVALTANPALTAGGSPSPSPSPAQVRVQPQPEPKRCNSGGGAQGGSKHDPGSRFDSLNCRQGYVVDSKKHICVQAERGAVPDGDLTEYAFLLAKHHRFEEALATLDLLENPNTPVALNYRGYATRKLGRIDEGIGYYLQSVALDPTYPQVREYLGEAYVIKGRLDLAQEQLTTIASICGTTCEYYSELADAIAGHPIEE